MRHSNYAGEIKIWRHYFCWQYKLYGTILCFGKWYQQFSTTRTPYRLYELFGNKQLEVLKHKGTYFAVWAPMPTQVRRIGNFMTGIIEAHKLYVAHGKKRCMGKDLFPRMERWKLINITYMVLVNEACTKGSIHNLWERKNLFNSIITWGTYYEWTDRQLDETSQKNNALNSPFSSLWGSPGKAGCGLNKIWMRRAIIPMPK